MKGDTIHSIRLCLALSLLPLLGACTLHYDAPRSPDPVLPANLEMPPNPPAPGSGRAIIDVEGESAKVERVIDSSAALPASSEDLGAGHANPGAKARTELLCMTPCVVDMRRGAHVLWLRSPTDQTRSSVALINIPTSDKPIAVRHALGRSQGPSNAYTGGVFLTFIGGAFTFLGSVGLAGGGLVRSLGDGSGGGLMAFGLAFIGVGLAMGLPGLWLLMTNRAVHQPGATTMWQP